MTLQRHYFSSSKAFSIILKIVWIIVAILFVLIIVKSCSVCTTRAHIKDKTGYDPNKEDWDNIPDVTPPYNDDDTLNIPDIVMLEQFFPPIGNQGDKGTCVAWAIAYNLKTALNAIDSGWTSDKLANPAFQTSPRDLWLSIPLHLRNEPCSGTAFEAALSVLKNAGAASMEAAPYDALQNCTGRGIGDTTNRIASFFKVSDNGQQPSIAQIKNYIADTIPLAIGARLGDRFMNWHNDDVISYDSYNYTGPHAFHAMVLVGFDDSRHAFRLRNSWGPQWGDNGSIWVDYNFFCNEMCFVVLIANNSTNENNPPSNADDIPPARNQ